MRLAVRVGPGRYDDQEGRDGGEVRALAERRGSGDQGERRAEAIAAALTVSLKRSAPLLALLVLPLTVPVVIFGTRAAAFADAGLDATGSLYLLAAMLVLAATLAPFAVGAALRIGLE